MKFDYHNNMQFNACPKCKSRDLEVGITMQRVVTLKSGRKECDSMRDTDAGYTRCLQCGYEETP